MDTRHSSLGNAAADIHRSTLSGSRRTTLPAFHTDKPTFGSLRVLVDGRRECCFWCTVNGHNAQDRATRKQRAGPPLQPFGTKQVFTKCLRIAGTFLTCWLVGNFV